MDGSSSSREQSPAPDQAKELSKSMNAASRRYHTILNRLILSRLPRALPPQSGNPEAYVTGLLHFAPVYLTFESIWERFTQSESDNELPLDTAVVMSALIHLHIPELLRTERLLKDISVLARISQDEVAVRLYTPQGEQLMRFLAHIEATAEAKPHVLIAYAWVLYMALFNGGHWIRAQLQAARDSSWHLSRGENKDADSKSMSERADYGLSFWTFKGERDGLEFKDDFKTRLSEVENMLSKEQRNDIVNEAKVIFHYCASLVQELDGIVDKKRKARKAKTRQNATTLMGFLVPLGLLVLMLARWVWSYTDYSSLFLYGRAGS